MLRQNKIRTDITDITLFVDPTIPATQLYCTLSYLGQLDLSLELEQTSTRKPSRIVRSLTSSPYNALTTDPIMRRIRLQVRVEPLEAPSSPAAPSGSRQEKILPWTEPCSEDLPISELWAKIESRFERIYPGRG